MRSSRAQSYVMRYRIRIPTADPSIMLEAKVEAVNWRSAISAVLSETGRDGTLLDRADVHLRGGGRVVIEDPRTLRLFEIIPEAASGGGGATLPGRGPARTESFSGAERKALADIPILIVQPDPPEGSAEPAPTSGPQGSEVSPEGPEKIIEEPGRRPATPSGKAESPLGKMDRPTVHLPASAAARRDRPGAAVGALVSARSEPDDLFEDLRSGRDLETVAGTLLRAVRARIPADAGVVLVPDGRRRHLVVAAGFGLPSGYKVRRFKFGDGVGGFALEFDTAISVDDLDRRPDLLGELEEVFSQLAGVMAAPLRAQSLTHGSVELFRREPPAFDAKSQALLKRICFEQARRIG